MIVPVVLSVCCWLLTCCTAQGPSTPSATWQSQLSRDRETHRPQLHRLRLWGRLNSPREHPTWSSRPTRPPELSELPAVPSLGGPRYFGELLSNQTALRRYLQQWIEIAGCRHVWPASSALCGDAHDGEGDNSSALNLVAAVRDLNMTLGQLNGFHPASEDTMQNLTTGSCQVGVDAANDVLGHNWLGISSCEEGSRYLNSYATDLALVSAAGRLPMGIGTQAQLSAFDAYMERQYQYVGRKVVALTTSTAEAAPWLDTGFYTLVGSETSQSHGSVHVLYAFNRGAAKQHGVQLHGDVSVFTKFGHKVPGDLAPTSQCEKQSDHSSTCGTSLSLLKRLLYTESLWGSAVTTVEGGTFYGRADITNNYTLTPIGKIQKGLSTFFELLCSRDNRTTAGSDRPFGGYVHLASIAILHDAHSGWNYPCGGSPSKPQPFRAWGNSPWGPADYLLDSVLNVTFPHYARGAWYRDESGYLGETPFGDGVDVLGDDAAPWLLGRYDTVIVTARLWRNPEATGHRLRRFIEDGGNLILTASSMSATSAAGVVLMGATVSSDLSKCKLFPAGTTVQDHSAMGSTITEPRSFTLCPYETESLAQAETLMSVGSLPAVVRFMYAGTANGSLTVILAGQFATSSNADSAATAVGGGCLINGEAVRPFPTAHFAQRAIYDALQLRKIFDVGNPALAWTALRKTRSGHDEVGSYLISISNPTLVQQPLSLMLGTGLAAAGAVLASSKELRLDESEKSQPGYWPHNYSGSGTSGPGSIAGGDIRIFEVTVHDSTAIVPLDQTLPVPPQRQQGTWMRLPAGFDSDLHQAVRHRPSLFHDIDGVVVDWRYVIERSVPALEADGKYLRSRNFAVAVDATDAINPYPWWRLCNDSATEYSRSLKGLQDLISRLPALQATQLILTTHNKPEGSKMTPTELLSSMASTLNNIADTAAGYGITLQIRQSRKNLKGWTYAACRHFVNETVGHKNVKLAPSSSLIQQQDSVAATNMLKSDIETGLVNLILFSAPLTDPLGQTFSDYGLISSLGRDKNKTRTKNSTAARLYEEIYRLARLHGATVILDAAFASRDEELRDVAMLGEFAEGVGD